MGPTIIDGLPAHVLLVHFVVVLVPLAALLLILVACWPAARARLGVLVPLTAFTALVTVPLTTHSGEWLAQRSGDDPLIRRHADLGDQLLIWSAATFLLSAVWWALHSRRAGQWWRPRFAKIDTLSAHRAVSIVLAAVAVAVSVGSMVQVYRIGDSGARAAWHDRVADQSAADPAQR
ncbi:DUF2231 domain-containing protein [Nocardia sp. alder85J]|uniref:DUF2231 domain-containing protein n=1 Tax=Nocardia sp. alder85J TaxID=2862949 RepID=UPI001CD3EC90|nr:DUF2231 domain-containing protein [Nocardia sp. alder85J]MCX4092484.1 hypothetical protein [Nocardia sp. alder85J]